MTMEISPQHHVTVLGKNNINLKIIMQRTNTTIIFPDAGDPNIPPIKKGSVTISSNSIHNVYLARQLLLGSLPIVMMFDIPESLPVDDTIISKLQVKAFHVFSIDFETCLDPGGQRGCYLNQAQGEATKQILHHQNPREKQCR